MNSQTRMHDDEISIDVDLVRRLLAEQFPHLANETLSILNTTGTVNAICRVGQNFAVRLPRKASWASSIEKELTWLPKLAPHLSLKIPKPYAKGEPTEFFPHPWAIFHWLEGVPYEPQLLRDEAEAARDLAQFVQKMRSIPMADAPTGWRKPLADVDAITRDSISASKDLIDVQKTMHVWDKLVRSDPWNGEPVWMHGDLLRGNLLVKDGQLSAVIDFGLTCIGDPAADLIPAWAVFDSDARTIYRDTLAPDDATWVRARAYTLHQAVMIIPYYRESNLKFVEMAVRTVGEVLD